MKSKIKRYEARSPGPTTFASGDEIISLTEDFPGGPVVATSSVNQNVGAGQWAAINFLLDGVVQGMEASAYQPYANLNLTGAMIMIVPPGTHRIGLRWGGGATPVAASCIAMLSILVLE